MNKDYKDVYSEIKDVKNEKDMENSIEELSEESVLKNIESEMSEFGQEERSVMLKRLDLGEKRPEKDIAEKDLGELMEYAKEIDRLTDKFSILQSIEPKGENGRAYDEEFGEFYKKIKSNLSEEKDLSREEYEKMCPAFIYPVRDKINLKELEEAEIKLVQLKRQAENLKNDNTKTIVSDLLKMGVNKIKFHEYFVKGDSDKAFEQAKLYYGDISDELCTKAKNTYENKLEYLKKRPKKSDLEKKLEDSEFNAQEIKTYFELALVKAGLKDSGYEVAIDDSVTNIRVSEKTAKYDHGVILIPPNKKASGMEILELCSYEIGRHVTTNYFHQKNGFRGSMGEGWDTINEGVSKRSERDVRKEVLKDSFNDFEIDAAPYYILAMEKIRGEKNNKGEYENGCNFAQVFKYIYKLSLEENLCDSGYYRFKDEIEAAKGEERESLETKLAKIKERCDKKAVDLSKKTCLRTFKGFDPKTGGKYLPKDKIYFDGETQLSDLENAGSVEKYCKDELYNLYEKNEESSQIKD